MDDIICVHAKPDWWDHERFIQDLEKSEVYAPPLALEEGTQGTFLETRFRLRGDNTFSYYLKNDNEDGKQKIWRYQHFRSYSPYLQKRALLTACLKKVQKMASDTHVLKKSALDKIHEFQRLQYPKYMLKHACTFVAASMGVREWLDVRDQI